MATEKDYKNFKYGLYIQSALRTDKRLIKTFSKEFEAFKAMHNKNKRRSAFDKTFGVVYSTKKLTKKEIRDITK